MYERIWQDRLLDCITDGVYAVDRNRTIHYWNRAAERITGYTEEDMIGARCNQNILDHVDAQGTHLCVQGCPLHATMQDGEERETVVYLRHKLGHRVPVSIRSLPIREQGVITGAVEIFSDRRSQRDVLKEFEAQKRLALIDPLTGLGNRRWLDGTLEKALLDRRLTGVPIGTAMIDIDRFKAVNDTYGHAAGDRVLQLVANVLRHSMHAMDSIGRWGGEEFLCVLKGCPEDAFAARLERMRMLVAESVCNVEQTALQVCISIGGTHANDEDAADSLVRRADGALYESKRCGRNRVTIR